MKKTLLTSMLISAALTLGAVPAQGAVTIGSNLASMANANDPGCNAVACTGVNLSLAQASQAPNGLTSPVNGTVTSWRASTNNGFPIALRVLRPVGGTTFTGAGTSALADPDPGVTPPISTSVPIRSGDFIGLDSPMPQFIYAAGGGAASTAGAWFVLPGGPLAEGSTRSTDATLANRELLVQATIEPSNTLTFGAPVLNRKKGTATMTVDVPNAGQLAVAGAKVTVAGVPGTVGAAGQIQVTVQAAGKSLKRLKKKGKVTVSPTFTFTPNNGTAKAQATNVTLKKKKKKKKK